MDSKALEKEVRRLEREIEKQEGLLSELDRQLADAAADYLELMRLTAEKEAADRVLNELLEQWEQASEKLMG